MSNLQTPFHLKLDFQKVYQQIRGKWLIQGKHQTPQEQSVARPGTAL